MAKIKNKTFYSDDIAWLERLADELEFIGRSYTLVRSRTPGESCLIQFALPPRKVKRKKEEVQKAPRNKRAESAARHS